MTTPLTFATSALGPGDPAAERATLACVCAFGRDFYEDVSPLLSPRTFQVDSNSIIWRCLDKHFTNSDQNTVDYPSILAAASDLGFSSYFDPTSEKTHLRAVLNMPVKEESGRRFAARIRKLEVARLLQVQLEQARQDLGGVTGEETVEQLIARAEQPIFDLTSLLNSTDDGSYGLMGDGARDYVQHLIDNPRSLMGVSTGFPRYDRSIGGGIRPNSVDIIAARSKGGKSWLVDTFGLNVAGQNIPSFNVDTEMSKEEHLHRIIANLSGEAVYDIETGKVGTRPVSKKKALDAADRLAAMPYYYQCVIGRPFEDILASMRRWVMRTVGLNEAGKANPCVILYDYIKLMNAEGLGNHMAEYQMLGFIATALKNFMGRYGAGCVCFAQQNRSGIDGEGADTLAGADRIVHYCTSLTIFKKKSEAELAEADGEALRYRHKLVYVLSRHGEGLQEGDYINVCADFRHGKLVEGPTKSEMQAGVRHEGGQRGFVVADAEEPIQ